MGRSYIYIDWDKVLSYSECMLNQTEIASKIGVSLVTLRSRCEKEMNMTLKEYMQPGKEKCRGDLKIKLKERAIKSTKFSALKFALTNYTPLTDKKEIVTESKNESNITDEERIILKQLAIDRARKIIEESKNE